MSCSELADKQSNATINVEVPVVMKMVRRMTSLNAALA
jgi:hypothetical protein